MLIFIKLYKYIVIIFIFIIRILLNFKSQHNSDFV